MELSEGVLSVSCLERKNLDQLTTVLGDTVETLCHTASGEVPTVVRHRHQQHLTAALEALEQALVSSVHSPLYTASREPCVGLTFCCLLP